MKVFWTPEARARLLEIQAYIAKDSPAAARSVAARLLRRSRQLAPCRRYWDGACPNILKWNCGRF